MTLTSPDASAFDALAARYDATFTDTVLGTRYRAAVWRRFDALCDAGAAVLEVGCGTGVDALELARRGRRVLATDASASMVSIAAARARGAGLAVDCRVLRAEDLGVLVDEGRSFDAVLSDFGALNCVASLAPVAADLGALVRPGGRALVCLMGPFVPWELAWFLARGRPRTALRRLRGHDRWRDVDVRYPSPRAARRAFAPWFATARCWGLGVLMPPPYAEHLAARHPRALGALDRAERRIEACHGVASLGDHFVLELVRRCD